MNDPHMWWYVTRSSAILAWVVLSISVVWGILLSTRVARRIDNPAWLQDLHRYLSGMGVVLVGVHMLSLMLDGYAHFTLAQLFVPFTSTIKPIGVAIGISAMYLLLAVWGSSMLRERLPKRVWRAIHYASYAIVLAVALHAGLTGSDVGEPWYTVLAGAIIGTLAAATILRVLVGSPARTAGTEKATQERGVAAAELRPNSVAAEHAGIELVLRTMTRVAEGVTQFEFARPDNSELPIWWPGDHVSLRLPNGLVRQYSLCGDPADRRSWTIAVRRDPNSRGGSAWLHEQLRVGDRIRVLGPIHGFALEPARSYLFIAAGIGITPIHAMIAALPANRDWRLLYIGRALDRMAFASDLLRAYPDRVQVWETQLEGGRIALEGIDFDAGLVYACGPEGLLDALAALVPPNQLRIERFQASDIATREGDRAFTLECQSSGVTVRVAEDESALTALERAGVPIYSSCREGSCGSCELRVVSGEPDHRDSVLDDASKDRFGVMYPCVSRARGETLVVDA